MPVVLGKLKKRGLSLAFDYENKVFLLKDYIGRTHVAIPVEEVINLLIEKAAFNFSGKKEFSNQGENANNGFFDFEVSEEDKKLLISRLYKTEPKLYKNNQVIRFSPKGLKKMIDLYFKNYISESEKEKLEYFVIQELYNNFFIKRGIPSTETIRSMLSSLKRKIVEPKLREKPLMKEQISFAKTT